MTAEELLKKAAEMKEERLKLERERKAREEYEKEKSLLMQEKRKNSKTTKMLKSFDSLIGGL